MRTSLGKLSGKNILITGATGLIGSTLVEVLMANPNRDYMCLCFRKKSREAKNVLRLILYEIHSISLKYDVMLPLSSDIPLIILFMLQVMPVLMLFPRILLRLLKPIFMVLST